MGSKRRPYAGNDAVKSPKRDRNLMLVPTKPPKRNDMAASTLETGELDEIAIQIREERIKALKILDSMLSTGANASKTGSSDSEGDGSVDEDISRDRVDVNRSSQPMKKEVRGGSHKTDESVGDHDSGNSEDEQEDEMQDLTMSDGKDDSEDAVVQNGNGSTSDKNQSYTVRTDLKQLFSSTSDKDMGGFTFLTEISSTSDENKRGSKKEGREFNSQDVSQSTPMNHTKLLDEIIPTKETDSSPGDVSKCLFFHSGSDLRNRLDDEPAFCCVRSVEELEGEWPARRTAMKQSFKRRHKDALRLGKRKKQGRTLIPQS